MSTQIQFIAGTYIKFTATRDFSLGGTDASVMSGTEFLFDGTHAIFNGGQPIHKFQLRGAYKAGWIVPSEDFDPTDSSHRKPLSAGIMVSAAIGGNPLHTKSRTLVMSTAAEEHEVGDVASHAEQTKVRNSGRRQPQVESTGEGITVRSVTTPAKQVANLEVESVGEIIRRAESVKIKPCQGRTREEVLAEMSDVDRQEYLSELEARRNSKPGVEVATVSSPKNVEMGGFRITNSVSQGSTPVEDLSGSTGKVDVRTIEVDGIKITNTNGPKLAPKKAPAVRTANADPRRTIARSICADFPDNYNFDDPVRKKIARLQADYDDRPDVIRAVAAAEDDAMKGRIVVEFPEAFTG